MKFAPYWSKAIHGPATVWRWSFHSLDDARLQAGEAARRLAQQISGGDFSQRRSYADYSDRPMREQVLRELRDAQGNLAAAVTRNTYGCSVLNAAKVMFLDIDCGEAPRAGGGGWLRWFRKPAKPAELVPDVPLEEFRRRLADWMSENAGWSMRVYRTRAGVRLLVTHELFDPVAAARHPVFQTLGVDPLYQKLCLAQSCFRARLTPKPWRCNIGKPPGRWPWPDATAESKFNSWHERYHQASQAYATCKLIETVGNGLVHPEVQTILRLHDELTRAESGLPLA